MRNVIHARRHSIYDMSKDHTRLANALSLLGIVFPEARTDDP